MGFLDKAKDLLGKHDEKVDEGIEKAGDTYDERTGDQHSEHVDKVQDLGQEHTGEGDTAEGGDDQQA